MSRARILAPLGFASGLPYLLSGTTLAAWMTGEGVDLRTVGLLSLVGLPYTFKFVWAPLLDRFPLPLLGRRRGWLAALQIAVAGAIALVGSGDPRTAPSTVAAAALLLAFLSASQDVVADAYQADVLAPGERAAGGAAYVAGFRVGMLVAGATALVLADHLPWRAVYALLAALMTVGVVTTLRAPEPTFPSPRSLGEALAAPLREFFARRGALLALAFITLFRLGDVVVQAMIMPFLLGLGFGRTEVGLVQNGLGLGASIVGTLSGALLASRLGLLRALLVAGVLQALANLGYAALAAAPGHVALAAAIAVDNLCNGLGIAASVAFLLSLTDRRYSATQLALLTSASGAAGRLVGAGSGWFVHHLGWSAFFLATVVVALPALALLAPLQRAGLLPRKTDQPESPARSML